MRTLIISTTSLFSALPYDTTLHTGVESGFDPYSIPIVPGDCLYNWIEKFGNLLAGFQTLFLIDDIANEALDKKRQPLLGLAISGRPKGHLLWLLTHSYTAFP